MIIIPQNVLCKTDLNVLHQIPVKAYFGMWHVIPSQFTNIIVSLKVLSHLQHSTTYNYLVLLVTESNRGQMTNHPGY